jgi:hypothetical protein
MKNELKISPQTQIDIRNHHPLCHPELVSGSAVDDVPRMLDPETSSG